MQSQQSMRPATATPTPIPFVFQTVDDPNSNVNEVTAINQRSKVVGVWGAGSGSGTWETYTTQAPYNKLRDIDDPDTQGTFATSITSNKIIAGYVMDPKKFHGIYGFIHIKSKFNLFKDPNEGKANNAITEILALNDSEFAVGLYNNAGGRRIPFYLDVANSIFTDLNPPNVTGDAAGTSINGKGEIVGWETTSAGVMGFYLHTGTYYPFAYAAGVPTYALGINWSDQVVGYYLDSTNVPHGFLLLGPTKGSGQQVWQTIDAPNGTRGTVVTGINNHHVICGYYVDGGGVQHGFVAVPKK